MSTQVRGRQLQEGFFLTRDRREAQGRSHRDTSAQGAMNLEVIPEDQAPLPLRAPLGHSELDSKSQLPSQRGARKGLQKAIVRVAIVMAEEMI